MKLIFIALLFISMTAFSQSTNSFEDAITVRLSTSEIQKFKSSLSTEYYFYKYEYYYSFEFITPEEKYEELVAFDWQTNTPKAAPHADKGNFNIFNYKFIRDIELDKSYRIPNSNLAIILYSLRRVKDEKSKQ